MGFKVLFTDFEYKTLEPEEKVLRDLIPDVEFIYAQCKTEDEVIEAAKDVDGLINQYAPISRKVIETLTKCKVIARYGVGVNTIDVRAATEKDIFVCNVTDYCLDEVSDHAMTLLLAAARKVTLLNNNVKKGIWDFKAAAPVFRLRDQTLGLVGFGQIPQQLAKKAQAFGLKVVAYDPFVPKERAGELNVELLELNELCKQSDYISVHAPLMKATEGMVGKEQFMHMKNNAFIINTARGPVIDEKALIEALQNKGIAGAALDVVVNEPIEKDNALLEMDQVILTPHMSWYSEESQLDLKEKTAKNVADALLGIEPKYVVRL